MSRFPIPESGVGLLTLGGLAGLVQGLSLTGKFPLPDVPPAGGPILVSRWDLTSFYLPVSVTATAGGGTSPTVCHLALQLTLSGDLAWEQSQDVPLVPLAPAPGWVGGSAHFNDSPANPIPYRNGQAFALGFYAQFDQTIVNGGVFLSAIYNDPAAGLPIPALGSIGYTEVAEAAITQS